MRENLARVLIVLGLLGSAGLCRAAEAPTQNELRDRVDALVKPLLLWSGISWAAEPPTDAELRKKVDALPTQTDLLNQQIAELQAAASSNAEQIAKLAAQLKEVVAALELAGTEAAAQRARIRKLAFVAVGVSVLAVALAGALLFLR